MEDGIFTDEDKKVIEFYEKYKGKEFRKEDIISKSVGNSYSKWNNTRNEYCNYILTNCIKDNGQLVLVIDENYFLPKDIMVKANNLNW
jgi:hypothetical protein